jgi:small subunit ribosomal protein S19e
MAVFDVYPNDLIKAAAEELKKIAEIKPPEWAGFVKTGRHKERVPSNPDWWHTRVAAVLRSVYKLGPIGVSKLRAKYGGKKRRGHKMPHAYKGSGNIIRKALQQLEKAGLVKQVKVKGRKGRVITPKGKSFLDKIAVQISKKRPKPKHTKEKPEELIKKEKPKEKVPAAEELVKKTKEHFTKPKVTAEKLVEEAGEEARKKPAEKIPTAHELAKKKEEK